MLSPKLILAIAGVLLLIDLGLGATIRDSMGRQINFPDTETVPDGGQLQPAQSGGFISRIFDMLKNLLGLGNERTTVMRSDGTVEEVDVPSGGGGFISRISKRLMGFISSILGVLTGDQGSPRLDGYSNSPSRASNEIERELMKMASQRS